MNRSTHIFCFLLLVAATLLGGCGPVNKPSDTAPRVDVVSETLQRNAGVIDKAIADGTAAAPKLTVWPVFKSANESNKTMVAQVARIGKDSAAWQKRAESADDPLRAKLAGMMVTGIFLMCIGGIGMAIDSPVYAALVKSIGGGLMLCGGMLLVLSATTRALLPWMVWFALAAGIMGLMAVGYIIWRVIRTQKEKKALAVVAQARAMDLAVESKATDELVNTVDTLRKHLPADAEKKLFSDGGIVKQVQSPTTQVLVANSKARKSQTLTPQTAAGESQ